MTGSSSKYYYWNGLMLNSASDRKDQTAPKVHTKYRARLKLIEMALGELEFLSQTAAPEADLLQWERFVQDVLQKRHTFMFKDPHGMTWFMFEEDHNHEHVVVVTD